MEWLNQIDPAYAYSIQIPRSSSSIFSSSFFIIFFFSISQIYFLPHQYWCRIILQNCAYKVHLMDSLNSIAFLFRNRETSDHPRADCGHRLWQNLHKIRAVTVATGVGRGWKRSIHASGWVKGYRSGHWWWHPHNPSGNSILNWP